MWIYRSIFAWVLHKMFKQRIRVSHVTFQYICENLSSKLKKQPTSMKDPISVKDKALGTMASMASIAIVFFLHNQRKFKNIPCFLALPENLAFSFRAIKVSTSKSFNCVHYFFLHLILKKILPF